MLHTAPECKLNFNREQFVSVAHRPVAASPIEFDEIAALHQESAHVQRCASIRLGAADHIVPAQMGHVQRYKKKKEWWFIRINQCLQYARVCLKHVQNTGLVFCTCLRDTRACWRHSVHIERTRAHIAGILCIPGHNTMENSVLVSNGTIHPGVQNLPGSSPSQVG
jgi:hypothetical protein